MKFFSVAGLVIGFAMVGVCQAKADTFAWEGGPSGMFNSTTDWFDETTGQHHVGPPGPNDIASISSGTITFEGGSVQRLYGNYGSAEFDFEGQFSAGDLSQSPAIIGAGQLTAGTVSGDVHIQGGHVVANSLANSETTVKAGGSLLVHGLFTDHVDVECADIGSSIDAEGGMTDVGLVVGPGGQVTAANISNLLGSSCTFQGAAAMVSVTRDFMLAEAATLDLSSGATLQVG